MAYLQHFLPDPLIANQLEMNLLHSGFAEANDSLHQAAPRSPRWLAEGGGSSIAGSRASVCKRGVHWHVDYSTVI